MSIQMHDAAVEARHAKGQLTVEPHAPRADAAGPTGSHVLAGVPIYVPTSYRAARPAGVIIMLHGAGGRPDQAMGFVDKAAEHENVIVVAPKSVGVTWDVIAGGYGPDVAQIDQALDAVFERYAIDPQRIAIGGFSDGASYALSLGLGNGELLRAIIALSPGFEASSRHLGTPKIFIAHGTADRVLPIDRTSRRIVPRLRRDRYDVEYIELDGGHHVPPHLIIQAMEWWAAAVPEARRTPSGTP